MNKYLREILSLILVIVFIFTVAAPVLAETSNSQSSETTTDQSIAAPTDTTTDTTTALRMQPLVDKYNSLVQADLDTELAKYLDSSKHWGKTYISKISALEIISGYGYGKFGPNDTLLGGQYILMLIRIMGFRPEVPQGTPYYKPFVDVAIKEGILIKGEITDYMKPITRELAASLARRVIGTYEVVPTDYYVPGDDTLGKGDKGFFDNVYVGYQQTKMADYTTITNKYLQGVLDCYRMGLLTGSGNKFNPKGNLTRAEASVIIVKLLDKSIRVESIPSTLESFKFTNPKTMDEFDCTEEYGRYENKEYTLYKGYFPLMEIWDTAYAMNKNTDKIIGGAFIDGFHEKSKGFGLSWFNNKEIAHDYLLNNSFGLIVPQNLVAVYTEKTKIKKGMYESMWDNTSGYLYYVASWDVNNYNTSLKPYTNELMKVWFGKDYEQAKKLHDQYLNYALADIKGVNNFYLINGRQIYIYGGRDIGGVKFGMQVWAKDLITKDTMAKN